MTNDNGNPFNPDAFARALGPYFQELGSKIDQVRTDLGGRIDDLGGRIDHLTTRVDQGFENQGGHFRHLEERVERLEKKVFSKD